MWCKAKRIGTDSKCISEVLANSTPRTPDTAGISSRQFHQGNQLRKKYYRKLRKELKQSNVELAQERRKSDTY